MPCCLHDWPTFSRTVFRSSAWMRLMHNKGLLSWHQPKILKLFSNSSKTNRILSIAICWKLIGLMQPYAARINVQAAICMSAPLYVLFYICARWPARYRIEWHLGKALLHSRKSNSWADYGIKVTLEHRLFFWLLVTSNENTYFVENIFDHCTSTTEKND